MDAAIDMKDPNYDSDILDDDNIVLREITPESSDEELKVMFCFVVCIYHYSPRYSLILCIIFPNLRFLKRILILVFCLYNCLYLIFSFFLIQTIFNYHRLNSNKSICGLRCSF